MKQFNNLAINKGFTLIELIIVIGVITISLPVIFGLFFLVLQAQSKIYILQEVKRNGDYALNILQTTIKQRGYAIYSDSGLTAEVCSTKSSPTTPLDSSGFSNIYFKDKDGYRFYFYIDGNNRIASDSPRINPNPYLLTNNKVSLTNFTISCRRTSIYSPPIVAVSFTVSQAGIPARHEEKASMGYQTKIKLKSY